jgi:glycosyltransferase 2 family protein
MIPLFHPKSNPGDMQGHGNVQSNGRRVSLRLVTLIVLLVSGWFIFQKIRMQSNGLDLSRIDFSPTRIFLSLSHILVSILIGAWVWSKNLEALGTPVPSLSGMSVHLTANLSKYIPGSLWPYLGKIYLTSRNQIPVSTICTGLIWEITLLGFGGLAWTTIAFPFCNYFDLRSLPQILLGLFGLSLLGTVYFLLPKGLLGLLRLLIRKKWLGGENYLFLGDEQKIRLLFFPVFLGWGFLLAGFIFLLPLPHWNTENIARVVFAVTLSILAGLIIFFVPMGLGIREAVLVDLLAADINPLLLLEISIFFRFEFLLGEVFSLLLIFLCLKCTKRKNNLMEGI